MLTSAGMVQQDDEETGEAKRAARRLLRLRHERQRHLHPVDAAGPAWDLMLVLFGLEGGSPGIAVGELSVRANVPRTTAVRWVRELERHKFVELEQDSSDKRITRVRLTGTGHSAMTSAFAAADVKVL